MADLPGWIKHRIILYEQLNGPLPDVVATQGGHLIPRPNTPVIGKPFDIESLHRKINALLLRQELRFQKYGKAAENWPIGHTPAELQREYAIKSKAQIAAILEAITPSDCSDTEDGDSKNPAKETPLLSTLGGQNHLATPSPSNPEASASDRRSPASKLTDEKRDESNSPFLFGHQAGTPDALAFENISRPRVLVPRATKDNFRKAISSRVTKKAAHSSSAVRRGTRSGSATRPNHRPNQFDRALDVVDKPDENTTKAQHKPRRSRRLAGLLPKLSLPPDQHLTAPLHETLQWPLTTRKLSNSGNSGCCDVSKKDIPVKGTKPQGILKSRQTGAGRPRRGGYGRGALIPRHAFS